MFIFTAYAGEGGVNMKVRFKMDKFIKDLQTVSEYDLRNEEEKQKKRQEDFMRVVFVAGDLSQIEDIPTTELVSMLSEVDHYFGGSTGAEKRRASMANNVMKMKGSFPSRVL